MITSASDREPILDMLLRRTPLDVLLFDRDLICRYAAPAGDEFLGHPREELEGRHATEILPPATNGLGPVLERAARDRTPWRKPRYLFDCDVRGVATSFCWVIEVEPVHVGGYDGVMVLLIDSNELQAITNERDRLRAELEQVRRQEADRRRALHELRANLRSLLAPISGYLQVIARRPWMLAGRAPASLVSERVLPQIDELVSAVDKLGDIASEE